MVRNPVAGAVQQGRMARRGAAAEDADDAGSPIGCVVQRALVPENSGVESCSSGRASKARARHPPPVPIIMPANTRLRGGPDALPTIPRGRQIICAHR